MDKLEEYILKHREEMDRYKPSPSIRRKIGKELRTGTNLRWLSIAAMLAVILGTALVLFRTGSKFSQKSVGENNYKTLVKNNLPA